MTGEFTWKYWTLARRNGSQSFRRTAAPNNQPKKIVRRSTMTRWQQNPNSSIARAIAIEIEFSFTKKPTQTEIEIPPWSWRLFSFLQLPSDSFSLAASKKKNHVETWNGQACYKITKDPQTRDLRAWAITGWRIFCYKTYIVVQETTVWSNDEYEIYETKKRTARTRRKSRIRDT